MLIVEGHLSLPPCCYCPFDFMVIIATGKKNIFLTIVSDLDIYLGIRDTSSDC